MILRGQRLVVRSMQEPDVARLAEIAAEPEIWQRWGEVSEADLRERLAGTDDVTALVVELDGEVVGPDPVPRGDRPRLPACRRRHVPRGDARAARATAARRCCWSPAHLFEQRGHHRLTIDPAADNEPAIRCYAAAGFRTVGVMRRYERGRDGSFHDGLLMELVRPDQPSG